MPDRDIVLAKVAAIQKCLKRIEEVTALDPDRLNNLDVEDIFVLNLQRAVQSAIDVATHIIAAEGLGIADTIRGSFTLLEDAKIIDKSLSKKMASMVGFRNIAIHNYQRLDPEILRVILAKHLQDLEEFYTTILSHFGMADR